MWCWNPWFSIHKMMTKDGMNLVEFENICNWFAWIVFDMNGSPWNSAMVKEDSNPRWFQSKFGNTTLDWDISVFWVSNESCSWLHCFDHTKSHIQTYMNITKNFMSCLWSYNVIIYVAHHWLPLLPK